MRDTSTQNGRARSREVGEGRNTREVSQELNVYSCFPRAKCKNILLGVLFEVARSWQLKWNSPKGTTYNKILEFQRVNLPYQGVCNATSVPCTLSSFRTWIIHLKTNKISLMFKVNRTVPFSAIYVYLKLEQWFLRVFIQERLVQSPLLLLLTSQKLVWKMTRSLIIIINN